MATKSILTFSQLPKIRSLSSTQRNLNVSRVIYTNKTQQQQPKAKPSQSTGSRPGSNIMDVPGLSSNVVANATGPVGPGASKDSPKYKNPEYFLYHNMSYCEAEIEMMKYRCPQPTNKQASTA